MTKTRFAALSTICSAVLVAVFYAPSAFADTSARIEGNGAFSDNDIHISNTNTTRITQSNTANISNTVNANANTGNNSSSFNTGGDTHIDTGDAETNVRIDNDVNKNVLLLNGCGCDSNDIHASIHGNGAFSDNEIDVDQSKTTYIDQTNDAHIDNHVNANTNTGNNNSSEDTHKDWYKDGKNYDYPKFEGKEMYDKPYVYYPKKDSHSYVPFVKKDDHKYFVHPNFKDMVKHKYFSIYPWWLLSGYNTGGDTTIRTGDASSNVWISNSANSNFLRM